MKVEHLNLAELLHTLSETEKRIFAHLLLREPVARDITSEHEEGLTLGERVADKVAQFGGSWTFIFAFLTAMYVWMFLNVETTHPFDPYPFILLNLVLSCLAALQAPVIMMSQNRQTIKDRLDAQHDYEVNLKAEMEVAALHLKMDELRNQQWADLIALQERQLACLERLEAQLLHDRAEQR